MKLPSDRLCSDSSERVKRASSMSVFPEIERQSESNFTVDELWYTEEIAKVACAYRLLERRSAGPMPLGGRSWVLYRPWHEARQLVFGRSVKGRTQILAYISKSR